MHFLHTKDCWQFFQGSMSLANFMWKHDCQVIHNKRLITPLRVIIPATGKRFSCEVTVFTKQNCSANPKFFPSLTFKLFSLKHVGHNSSVTSLFNCWISTRENVCWLLISVWWPCVEVSSLYTENLRNLPLEADEPTSTMSVTRSPSPSPYCCRRRTGRTWQVRIWMWMPLFASLSYLMFSWALSTPKRLRSSLFTAHFDEAETVLTPAITKPEVWA